MLVHLEMAELIETFELNRLGERFITRTRALSLLRVALLVTSQFFLLEFVWFAILLSSVVSCHWACKNPRWGRAWVFTSLNLDLLWLAYAIAQTGFFISPLISVLPAITLLFALVFHRPFVLLPPLLLLPVLTYLDPDVPIKTLTLYSLLNACCIYLTNKILGEEEATTYQIVKLEQALRKHAIVEERQRISRDIHDGVGSILSALVMEADRCEQPEIRNLAKEALQETRYAISVMRDELDLKTQIKNCAAIFSKRHEIETQLNISPVISELPYPKALSLLRILQESLNNVGKHARASKVEIQASVEQNQFFLAIKDDGIGFDPTKVPKNHFGIRNIEERVRQMGGSFNIVSNETTGTQIQIEAAL